MRGHMRPLESFRFDDGIEQETVVAPDPLDDDTLMLMSKAEAIGIAHAAGLNLIVALPGAPADEPPSCRLGKVTLPLRWEQAPVDPEPVDHDLWFEASCGSRDFLVDGGGHTFPGRMRAWCPANDVRYLVSLAEMGDMSTACRYYVRGFLSGNEVGPPEDDAGETSPEDLAAWIAATRRFRQTGSWFGRWQTCSECGCVLLPDRAADYCHEHEPRIEPV